MTTQPSPLHHLLDRLRRGVLLEAEAEQLAGLVGELETRTEQAYDLQRIAHQTSNRSEAERARAAARVTELEAEVTRLTAGQCTHHVGMCTQHHTTPVDGCPYPKCVAARAATASA